MALRRTSGSAPGDVRLATLLGLSIPTTLLAIADEVIE
jgi:hypothetical protein